MNKWIVLGLLLSGSLIGSSVQANTHAEAQFHGNKVSTDELKSWIDEEQPMVILDARSKPYFDGTLIPNALWVPFDAEEQVL